MLFSAMWRRLFVRKILLGVLFLLLIIYLILNKITTLKRVGKWRVFTNAKMPHMQLEQNGEYWIYNNFMRSQASKLQGNATITLTTHGTYRDFIYLHWLLMRWDAPISMAVYVDRNELKDTIDYLFYMQFCESQFRKWPELVSMQLIFSDKDIAHHFSGQFGQQPFHLQCSQLTNYSKHIPAKKPPTPSYPLHLLRNVARFNAATFYVLQVDPGMLPTMKFVRNFLQLMDAYQPAQPLKSVYCIPVIPQFDIDSVLPIYKSQLRQQLLPYLRGNEIHPDLNLEELNNWLSTWVFDDDVIIYTVSRESTDCIAYVSSNAYEPMADLRYAESLYDQKSIRLQVLVGLEFDFIGLDGTFLIRHSASTKYSVDALWQPNNPNKGQHIRELIKLNALILGN